jgi:hypothetical protein
VRDCLLHNPYVLARVEEESLLPYFAAKKKKEEKNVLHISAATVCGCTALSNGGNTAQAALDDALIDSFVLRYFFYPRSCVFCFLPVYSTTALSRMPLL